MHFEAGILSYKTVVWGSAPLPDFCKNYNEVSVHTEGKGLENFTATWYCCKSKNWITFLKIIFIMVYN